MGKIRDVYYTVYGEDEYYTPDTVLFSSNNLDEIAKFLGVGTNIIQSFWSRVDRGIIITDTTINDRKVYKYTDNDVDCNCVDIGDIVKSGNSCGCAVYVNYSVLMYKGTVARTRFVDPAIDKSSRIEVWKTWREIQ